ncbi:MAG: hypothetical protein ACRD2L_08140, partial [Terriglobia bacterium]
STGFSLPGQPKGWTQNKKLADLVRYQCPGGEGGPEGQGEGHCGFANRAGAATSAVRNSR